MSLAISVNKGAISLCSCSCWLCCLRGFRMERNRTRPRSKGEHQRRWPQWAQDSCIYLPRGRKALKPLTWNVLFFLLAVIFWCSDTCFVMFFSLNKNSYISSLLPYFLQQSLRAIRETASWAKVLHKFHRIKIMLNPKAVCIFFFRRHLDTSANDIELLCI